MNILFLLAAYISEVIGTFAGFGSSTVFLPLALFFYDFNTALVLVGLMHIFGNIGRISFFKHGVEKEALLKFGVPSVIFTIIGALLVTYISQEMLKGLLGVFLVIYTSISLWKKEIKIRPTLQNSIVSGGVSGFIAGLIGTGGALRGAYLTAIGLPKEKYIATSAAIALAVDMTRVPIYFARGFLDSQYYWYIPLLFIVALAGSFTGKQIVKHIPQKKFTKVVLIAILLIGMKFISDWVIS